jgi:hypothetical protein
VSDRSSIDGSAEHLRAVRIAVLLIWLVIVLKTPYEAYASLPEGVVEGVGVGRMLFAFDGIGDLLFSASMLAFLRWGTCAAIVFALLWPVKVLLLVVCVNVFVLDLATKAISAYPNHAQFTVLIALFVVATLASAETGPPTVRSLSRRRREGVIWLLAVLIILPYTFIGIHRLREGGIALFVGDALPQYMAYTGSLYSAYPFGLHPATAVWPLLAIAVKAGFLVTTIFEVTSPVALVSRRCRVAWLCYMSGFHVGTLLLMNIFFWENLILIWIVLGWGLLRDLMALQWLARLYRRLSTWTDPMQRSISLAAGPTVGPTPPSGPNSLNKR